MIKAICFDLDGVFFTEQSFKNFCEKMSVNTDYDTALQVLKKSDEMKSFKQGMMTEEKYWDFVRGELQIDFTNEEIFKHLRDSYEINPEVLEIVKRVKRNGYKTCICSNNFETRIRELNNKFAFLEYFDVSVFSYEVGYTKPSKEIFTALKTSSSVEFNEIMYSDDSEEAINIAKGLGIIAFMYEGFESFKNKLIENNVIIN